MAGHSKWSKIKRQKGANDAKRGALFTKLGQNITLAASEGGGDLESNFKLRLTVDTAKKANMPSDNIDRAIKRGTGELKDAGSIQQITYEVYAPGGVPMLIDATTDNSNRTVAEVRKAVSDLGGSFGEAGSVAWQFKEIGLVVIRSAKKSKSESSSDREVEEVAEVPTDEAMLELMDIEGVSDIKESEVVDAEEVSHRGLEVETERNSLSQVSSEVENLGYIVDSVELVKVLQDPTQELADEAKEKLSKFVEAIEDLDDVQNVWWH